jgi:hypothetical protein
LGFWVKQSLLIWIGLYSVYLFVFDHPRSLRKIVGFALAAVGAATASYLIGYALWQENFVYWTFTVLGSHAVSPLRSLRHLFLVWPYFVIGLAGGAILFRLTDDKRLVGLWFIWLAVIAVETYTSGIAWMTNHIGPGSSIAGIWAISALAALWNRISGLSIRDAKALDWLIAGAALISVFLFFNGLGFIRVPVRPFEQNDAYRYVAAIEAEFHDVPRDRVLLDVGTWIYVQDGIVMKDRAPSIGERGVSETGDFAGIVGRLRQRYYTKILVRNFHSGDFWYDHELWKTSSGIRQALEENYREIKRIGPVGGITDEARPYTFNEISVLEPK